MGRIPGLPRTDLFSTFNTAALAFSPDGDLFISNEAQRVRIFDPANLEQIGELPTPAFQFPGHPAVWRSRPMAGAGRHLRVPPDGRRLGRAVAHVALVAL